jgi:hypothetical protein
MVGNASAEYLPHKHKHTTLSNCLELDLTITKHFGCYGFLRMGTFTDSTATRLQRTSYSRLHNPKIFNYVPTCQAQCFSHVGTHQKNKHYVHE